VASSFVISLDFELHWGIFDHTRPDVCRQHLMNTRRIIPRMIELFEEQQIAATWATVGALFCESKEELLTYLPSGPAFADPRFGIRHFLNEVGEGELDDPLHFAPSLVKTLLSTDYQEMATHTFSHLYALENGVTTDDFTADVKAAISIAMDRGVLLESIVFPRNQYGFETLKICENLGLKTFRGNPNGWAWKAGTTTQTGSLARRLTRLADALIPLQPPENPRMVTGLLDVPATLFLRPDIRRPILGNYLVNRVKTGMTEAARTQRVFHLWWHPHNFGTESDVCMSALEQILAHFQQLKDEFGMESRSMASLRNGL
jgi:hypothetical protein